MLGPTFQGPCVRETLRNPLSPSRVTSITTHVVILAFLQNAAIEYLSDSVCVSMFLCFTRLLKKQSIYEHEI